jgi:predicted PurR-regulated permease PerM
MEGNMELNLIVFIFGFMFSIALTGWMALLVSSFSKKTNSIIAISCLFVFIIGISGFASVFNAINKTEAVQTEKYTYEINRVTQDIVFFNNGETEISIYLDEASMSVQESTDNYKNVVVKSIAYKNVDWFIDFKQRIVSYDVYLDHDIYARYKNPDILYEAK